MRRSTLWVCALVAIATLGCDKIKPIVDSIKSKLPGAKKAPATAIHPAADTTKAQPGAPGTPTKGQPGVPAVQHPQPPRLTAVEPVTDKPYSSQDSGTVDPGMPERDVYSQWGPPMGVRKMGEYTYIFYPNGCEHTCGTADVVILENDKVIDAITRWPGHHYSGQSSSPAALPPTGRPRPGGDTLQVKRDSSR
jgi:hypothetical protein